MKKIYRILGTLCSSCLAWFVFFELTSVSSLLFGEIERPKRPTE